MSVTSCCFDLIITNRKGAIEMPTYINYYLVRWVDLQTGKFHEEELTASVLMIKKERKSIQILHSEYVRSKSLVR